MMQIIQVSLLLAAALLSEAAVACPPPGFDSASGFDIKQYVQGPWYIQEQVSPFSLPAARCQAGTCQHRTRRHHTHRMHALALGLCHWRL